MAETLTLNTDPDSATNAENLTPEEQDSLAIGEQMVAEQEQLLAGKYKNAEELEKAYVELQQKFGKQGDEDSEATGDSESDESEEDSEAETDMSELTEDESGSEFETDDDEDSSKSAKKSAKTKVNKQVYNASNGYCVVLFS